MILKIVIPKFENCLKFVRRLNLKDWGNQAKHCNNLFVFKILLTTPSNVLPLHLKQTFQPIIWIFTEGDRIESRLPSKIFSTLVIKLWFMFNALIFNACIGIFGSDWPFGGVIPNLCFLQEFFIIIFGKFL